MGQLCVCVCLFNCFTVILVYIFVELEELRVECIMDFNHTLNKKGRNEALDGNNLILSPIGGITVCICST